ncbi:hypothetical protein BG000_005068, partial [Podila horticola]
IVQELGNFLDQEYDDYWAKSLSNRITKNRHNIMASICNVLERHLTPASAGETIVTPAEVEQYIQMKVVQAYNHILESRTEPGDE